MRATTLLAACAVACAAAAQTPPDVPPAERIPSATATFINAKGERIGTAVLSQTPNGVLIQADVSQLPPGEHGFHIHETGECDPQTGFESAGGHYAPRGNEHGFQVPAGPHAGDMPNQFVSGTGTLRADIVNPRVTLSAQGEAPLLDADGSAIVIHMQPDDYESQPSGSAGERIACAVVNRGLRQAAAEAPAAEPAAQEAPAATDPRDRRTSRDRGDREQAMQEAPHVGDR